jgi:hypothetical protein
MSEEIKNYEVEIIKKKAYLIIGVIPRDTRAVAQQIQARLEYETKGRIDHVSEQDMMYEYVSVKGYHPLCLKEWLDPIKNKVIIHLLDKTEYAFGNEYIHGVIIDGSFALDAEVRKVYSEILEEQGYEVVVVPVQSDMLSIISYGLATGTSLKSLYSLWKKYNQQFSRTYEPMVDMPPAIVVDEDVSDPILIEIIQSMAKKNQIIVISKKLQYGGEYPFVVNHVMIGDNKIDVFWTKIAYHFNVKLVIESNADDLHKWHKISVPVIGLTSQFALEKNSI